MSLTIGSASPADRNVISGNDVGVSLQSGGATIVQNNYIGSDASGTAASGNDTGIIAISSVNGLALLDNVVAANLGDGISVAATGAVTLFGNSVGTNQVGAGGLGNGSSGIRVSNPAIVGDVATGNGNTIAFNASHGVTVGSQGIQIRGNSIFGNGATSFGIDLAGAPPSIDHCDPDSGANGLQNYPVIASAILGGGGTTISGTLDSIDAATYTIDFYSSFAGDNASNRAGSAYVGTLTVTTGSGGSLLRIVVHELPVCGLGGRPHHRHRHRFERQHELVLRRDGGDLPRRRARR